MKRQRIIISICLTLPLLVACTLDTLSGGSGSTTTNGMVVGKVVTASGAGAPRTLVRLFRSDYDPVKDTIGIPLDTTDSLGNFSFLNIAPNDYHILAVHLDHMTRTIVSGLHVAKDTVTAPIGTLEVPGTMKISLPSGINSATGYVYIPGTSCFVFLNNRTEYVKLDSVPPGSIPAISYSSTNSSSSTVIRYGVSVAPGETSVVWNPVWAYSNTLILNTSPTGAAIAGPVEDFPVLVRLTSSNFNFSQAQTGGADIRFTKSDNTYLPYEIERWDSVAQQAEIWVKVDTVRGNDSTQSITMYWGNPEAPDNSNGTAVFDTAAGFQGVWHLGENAGNIHDATLNRFNGARKGNQKQVPGKVGYGQGYDGAGDYTEMGDVCNPGASGFTVCAWVKLSTLKGYRAIMSKSSGDAPSPSYGWLVELGPDGALAVFMATDTGEWGEARTFVMASREFIVDTVAWHHIAVAVDRTGNGNCKLYIDGSMITSLSTGGDITGIGAIDNSAPLRLGSDAKGGCPWNGFLDECSLAFTARSQDWVKLCFMNQKTDDELVFFRINANKQ